MPEVELLVLRGDWRFKEVVAGTGNPRTDTDNVTIDEKYQSEKYQLMN